MSASHQRSHSREPPSRPTTPLRASSRTSLRSPHAPASAAAPTPMASIEPAFAELADSMADLEANMMHLQLMHESLARFGENFAAFLYGLNVNAFCVDFPEGPSGESWAREEARKRSEGTDGAAGTGLGGGGAGYDPENTFMTTDTSFVENPPQSTRSGSSKFATPAPDRSRRGGPRPSGIARGGSGIARGMSRGSASVAAGGGRGGPTVRGTRASGLARASAAAKTRGRA